MGPGGPRFGKDNLGKGSGGRPHGPPVGDRAGAGGVAGREQDQELMGSQLLGGARRGVRPPGEAALGEALVAQPEPLAVVHQYLQRRPTAIAKDEDGAGERVFVKGLLAESRQAVDAAAEVGRLDGHQDLHLWRDLQHYSAPQKRRARGSTSAGAEARRFTRMVAPGPVSRSDKGRLPARDGGGESSDARATGGGRWGGGLARFFQVVVMEAGCGGGAADAVLARQRDSQVPQRLGNTSAARPPLPPGFKPGPGLGQILR